ncbi:MAG TPA: ABC transporter ATP-binding protein [Candidatus Thermoplasmatota archaeon]|nr:ABC transporter ATP-binding protein [Candidatus Thermoplasmatota archaeon]
MLRFEGVTRRYGSTVALDGVSFALEPGSFTALVGENGAGKSTLLRIAATLERPSAGKVLPEERRARIGWLGQEPGLYDELTVRENLAFAARLFGREGEVEQVGGAFGARLDARARTLSRGEKQRAALARAFLCGELLLLDEPTTGLDAEGARTLGDALAQARGGRTLLVATHDAELVKRADRVLRLRGGRLA